jgi:alpha-tubulin suppressor-like RCC1 family protein
VSGSGCPVDGTVWAWGANDEGQQGDGTHDDQPVPHQVAGISAAWSISTRPPVHA